MFIDDTESRSTTTAPLGQVPFRFQASTTTEHKTGFKVAGVIGHEMGNGLRVEGEVYFSRADVDKLTYTGITLLAPQRNSLPGELRIPISGAATQLGGNVNVWYDLETGGKWRPFVGAGVGFMRVDQGDVEYDDDALARHVATRLARAPGAPGAPPLPPGLVPEISDTDTVLAYHVGAGIGYPLSEATTLQLGYRLQVARDLEFTGRNAGASVRATSRMRIHFLEVGIRYRF